VVATRARIGDWEGDTVVGRKNRGGLVTHLERVTRYLVAGRIPNKRASTSTPLCPSRTRAASMASQSVNRTLDISNRSP